MNVPHNLYIHVPFCIAKCNYCAFFSSPCACPDWDAFANNIIKELLFWADKTNHCIIPSIFFGGGTPSLMPEKCLEKILSCIRNSFIISENCEISLEANPGTLSGEKLIHFQKIGINRLSIGVQSFDDDRLLFLGRKHNAKQALDLIDFAQSKSIRTSADFIYGLPQDTPEFVANLCKQINSIGLQHCSLYELTIEKSTPFGKMNLDMPSNESMAEMYEAISNNLNLPRYEVSNYAVAGQECRHNQNIWDGDAYIGIGKGAAGRPFINNTWYEQLGNFEKFEALDISTRAVEKIITGMRQVRGVLLTDDVRQQINFDFVDKNPDLFIMSGNNRLAASNKGLLILDNLLTELVK